MRKLYLLLAALAIVGCGSNNTSAEASDELEVIGQEAEKMVGAFGDQREITEGEMAMFKTVTANDETSSYVPLSVSTQVVAGINYKFYCRYDPQESEGPAYCWVTIYKPLPGSGDPRILSIEK
ncbi:MAG: hypothetical protein MJY72_04795 [Bacteroidales bacterium]|nr:hypothetical protein [Bacteroidales bacterium]